jgi:hypothetical protein
MLCTANRKEIEYDPQEGLGRDPDGRSAVDSLCWSQITSEPQETRTAHVKADVQRYGGSKKSQLRAKLLSGMEIRGWLESFDDESFALREKDGALRTLKYADVQQVRKAGLSTGVKIAILAGVGIAVVVVVLVVAISKMDPIKI